MAYNKKLLYVSEAPVWITEAGSFGNFIQNGSPISNINLSAAEFFNDVITYSVTSGSLPTGLSLNSSTGVISGTISGYTSNETVEISITATDSEGETAIRDFSFQVLSEYQIDYLVVAGGGSGGSGRHAGGGGGGGMIEGSLYNITPGSGSKSVIIGAGGTGTISTKSTNGQNSSFDTITAIGGGRGGDHGTTYSPADESAGNGGSGGGGAHTAGVAAGTGILGQGHSGSRAVLNRSLGISGGGAGGPGVIVGNYGETANPGYADIGGPGKQSNIDGNNYYYAGGGGGGAQADPPTLTWYAGDGGIGGGGGGASSQQNGAAGAGGGSSINPGAPGIKTTTNRAAHGGAGGANTGGGGGAAAGWSNNGNGNGGNGGSGVVILRMSTLSYSGITTGNPTVTTDGSDTILTYTGSGTYTT